ncbi:MAG TPA: DUF2891 domain-containing protein [Caulobacteraceae bacterium]|nr:DUF2891 domain-containing protein [Caulobacteraceae bacterium]
MPALTLALAEQFAGIALGHVGREYPNKLDQVLTEAGDLASPRTLHPIFYGSFDWHSAVHSHWLLARVLRRAPSIASASAVRAWLDQAFTEANVAGELAFLARPATQGFERPYGWAWLLMLQAELEAHVGADGQRWTALMRPLARAFERRLVAWLPKATYPIRVGTHGSTAFALVLCARYAPFAEDQGLAAVLRATALRWYATDADCPAWEPGGADFLSPALIEAACMAELLPPDDFAPWFASFLPRLADGEPQTLFTPATVSDRGDGQIAHLDGLNLSRAWCFRRLARAAPTLALALEAAAERHLEAALPHLAADYMGEHWLASFALLALDGA